jgi:adenylyl cyclase-associated protein
MPIDRRYLLKLIKARISREVRTSIEFKNFMLILSLTDLKKVTSDMQTHKNPTLREGPAPFKTPTHGGISGPVVDKPPVFNREGKKWIIVSIDGYILNLNDRRHLNLFQEYQKGNNNLLVENAEMNNVVYMFRCVDSTVVIKGKINSITLDSCKKTSVVFESLVSAMEFINCQSVQMQVCLCWSKCD